MTTLDLAVYVLAATPRAAVRGCACRVECIPGETSPV